MCLEMTTTSFKHCLNVARKFAASAAAAHFVAGLSLASRGGAGGDDRANIHSFATFQQSPPTNTTTQLPPHFSNFSSSSSSCIPNTISVLTNSTIRLILLYFFPFLLLVFRVYRTQSLFRQITQNDSLHVPPVLFYLISCIPKAIIALTNTDVRTTPIIIVISLFFSSLSHDLLRQHPLLHFRNSLFVVSKRIHTYIQNSQPWNKTQHMNQTILQFQ